MRVPAVAIAARLLLFTVFVFVTPAAANADRSNKPRVAGFTVILENEVVRVSYRVDNGMSEPIQERIESGMPVTFRHRIELRSRRVFPLPSKVLSRAVVTTRVEYDSLTRRYELQRKTTTKPGGKEPAVTSEETRTTESPDEVRAWMTRIDGIVLALGLDPERRRRARVRVESSFGRRYILWMIPSSLTASAERQLES